jgi:hypothetical protein
MRIFILLNELLFDWQAGFRQLTFPIIEVAVVTPLQCFVEVVKGAKRSNFSTATYVFTSDFQSETSIPMIVKQQILVYK